jgi:hypothetical protein
VAVQAKTSTLLIHECGAEYGTLITEVEKNAVKRQNYTPQISYMFRLNMVIIWLST